MLKYSEMNVGSVVLLKVDEADVGSGGEPVCEVKTDKERAEVGIVLDGVV